HVIPAYAGISRVPAQKQGIPAQGRNDRPFSDRISRKWKMDNTFMPSEVEACPFLEVNSSLDFAGVSRLDFWTAPSFGIANPERAFALCSLRYALCPFRSANF
ncbi:MAG TPA: hypothetical protein VGA99_11615, partial [bacterium]